jgi:plastocyanin
MQTLRNGTPCVNTGAQSTGSPSFPSSALISTKGAKYKYTFTQKGTYQYTCILHPGTSG